MNDDLLGDENIDEVAARSSSSIAARLEALRQDPHVLGASSAALLPQTQLDSNQLQQTAAEPAPARQPKRAGSLAALAAELFGDERFKAACAKGLNARLQRTRDGATAESRISELAALVKLLRRSLTQLTARNDEYVRRSLELEHHCSKQVHASCLASESSSRAVQAELALAKRDAAQAASALKSAMATWHAELEWQKAEVTRMKRDLERVEAERDCARDEAQKAETVKGHVEDRFSALTKEMDQQMRDVQADSAAVTHALEDRLEAAHCQLATMQARAEAAEARCAAAEASVASALADRTFLKMELHTVEARLQELQHQHSLLLMVQNDVGLQIDALQLEYEQIVQNNKGLAEQRTQLEKRVAELLEQVDTQTAAANGLLGELQRALDEAGALRSALTAAQTLERSTAQREACLMEEKMQLKAGLASALEHKRGLESGLQAASEELVDLQIRVDEGKANAEMKDEEIAAIRRDLQQCQTQLSAQVEAATAAQAAAAAQTAKLAEKTTRLAHLEGELGAFQDVIGTGDQTEMLGRLVSRVATLETALAQAQMQRRELHNELIEIRGNIRVFCRVRPSAAGSAILCGSDSVSLRLTAADGKEHAFSFDHVFGPAASQANVFAQVADVVQSALDGYNVCLFSYGQTGAGKTHTMQGGSGTQQGIIPRSVHKILEAVDALREQGWQYHLEASYIEVYNETLRDLLAAGNTKRDGARLLDASAIKHDPAGGPTIVAGAERLHVASPAEADDLVLRAAAGRAVESTAMNAVSSRSHSVFMLYISGSHAASGTRVLGALNLVDLAGSERLARSDAAGQRQKEACSINKSLSSLGDVFSALAAKATHVPYRNSKLTHLLQPCLGGDGKTLMFVNINPEQTSVGESLCSLRFAHQVNACGTAARGGAKRHVQKMETSSQAVANLRRKPCAPASNLKAVAKARKKPRHC